MRSGCRGRPAGQQAATDLVRAGRPFCVHASVTGNRKCALGAAPSGVRMVAVKARWGAQELAPDLLAYAAVLLGEQRHLHSARFVTPKLSHPHMSSQFNALLGNSCTDAAHR